MLAEPGSLMGRERIITSEKQTVGRVRLETDSPIQSSFNHKYSLWPPPGWGWKRRKERILFPYDITVKCISYFLWPIMALMEEDRLFIQIIKTKECCINRIMGVVKSLYSI